MKFTDATILAPLTKGGNLPFRRLCVDFGATVLMGEMAYARQILRRNKQELALLRRHSSEPVFGAQLAAGRAEDAVAAGKVAVERGAEFVDVNAGCPIHDVVRRGMGATLLQRPKALARIVEAMVAALPVPVTVKIRTGWCDAEINASEVAAAMEDAGAAALTVHGRTREQRYTRAADWDLIGRIASERRIPVIGNGDVSTWYEAVDKRAQSGCSSVMIGRAALIKPWIFDEIANGRAFEPDAAQRVSIYRRFAGYLKEHFRDDERGRERAMRFLPWHLDFFSRYRAWPEATWREASRVHPLLQTRPPTETGLPVLEALLRDPRAEVHQRIADVLWEATDDGQAVERLERVAAEMPVGDADVEVGEVEVAQG
jgi:tRNA-dihydrouridine synthase 3